MSAQVKPPTAGVVTVLNHIPMQERGSHCPHCGSRYTLSQCIVISEPLARSSLCAIKVYECPDCGAVDLRGVYQSGAHDSEMEAELDLTAKLITELRYGL